MKTQNNLSIFLVDDDFFCLQLYKEVLENIGYKNISLFDLSADCLNSLTNQPDIVFLDYQMDNLNGIEVLKKIKRFNPNIIVLFISSQEEIQIAVNALKYGAFDYIIKKDFTETKIRLAMEKAQRLMQMLQKRNRWGFIKKAFAPAGVFSIAVAGQKIFSK